MNTEMKAWLRDQVKDLCGLAAIVGLIWAITVFCIAYAPQQLPV